MTRFPLVSLLLLSLVGRAAAQPEELPMPHFLERGRLGIQVQPMTPELREHMKAPADAGVLVVRVEAGSPAAEAGVQVGDVVTSAGGERVDAPHALILRVAKVPAGERLALGLVRDGSALELEVAPKGEPQSSSGAWEEWLGGGMRHGGDALRKRLDELERRMDELEKRLPSPKAT
jgi:predicted metalloprotease with PDZ domain